MADKIRMTSSEAFVETPGGKRSEGCVFGIVGSANMDPPFQGRRMQFASFTT